MSEPVLHKIASGGQRERVDQWEASVGWRTVQLCVRPPGRLDGTHYYSCSDMCQPRIVIFNNMRTLEFTISENTIFSSLYISLNLTIFENTTYSSLHISQFGVHVYNHIIMLLIL